MSSILAPVIVFPIQIGLLYYYLGIAGMAGVVITILNSVFLFYLSKVFKIYWRDTAIYADKRSSLVSDIISGIKTLKFYNWEKYYTE